MCYLPFCAKFKLFSKNSKIQIPNTDVQKLADLEVEVGTDFTNHMDSCTEHPLWEQKIRQVREQNRGTKDGNERRERKMGRNNGNRHGNTTRELEMGTSYGNVRREQNKRENSKPATTGGERQVTVGI